MLPRYCAMLAVLLVLLGSAAPASARYYHIPYQPAELCVALSTTHSTTTYEHDDCHHFADQVAALTKAADLDWKQTACMKGKALVTVCAELEARDDCVAAQKYVNKQFLNALLKTLTPQCSQSANGQQYKIAVTSSDKCVTGQGALKCTKTGTSTPNPACICPAVFDPVCGADGNTYSNACQAQCAGVKKFTKGACDDNSSPNPACICPAVFDPVCGADGNTYSNACQARCAGVKKYTKGACDDDSTPSEPAKPAQLCVALSTTHSSSPFEDNDCHHFTNKVSELTKAADLDWKQTACMKGKALVTVCAELEARDDCVAAQKYINKQFLNAVLKTLTPHCPHSANGQQYKIAVTSSNKCVTGQGALKCTKSVAAHP